MTETVTETEDAVLQRAVAESFLALADLLSDMPSARWDEASLCGGWQIRHVVAHMTMAARYSNEEILARLRDYQFDFTRLSDEIAARDANLPVEQLIADLRSERLHQWTPPGGGVRGALNHAVIHGLDVTVALDQPRCATDKTMRIVLDDLTRGGVHGHFGTDISSRTLTATDLDWTFGHGPVLRGPVDALASAICARAVRRDRLVGEPLRRATSADGRHEQESGGVGESAEVVECGITGVRTVGVPVTDQDRALAFYAEHLGLELLMDAPLEQLGGRWIELSPHGSATTIALEPARNGNPAGVQTGIRLATRDASALRRKLQERDVDVDEVLQWPGVPPMFALRDPDNNALLVVEQPSD